MAIDRRMVRLRARHLHEIRHRFRAFTAQNPAVEIGVRNADMTASEEAAWRAVATDLIASHRAERSALATALRAERGIRG